MGRGACNIQRVNKSSDEKVQPRGSARRRGRPRVGDDPAAREALVEAAIAVLREQGFVGASARTIAERAGVNSALVFYYFGTVVDLLLAAIDLTGERRLARYQAALGDVSDLGELVVLAARLNREDLDEGHIAVVAALVGGAAAIPGLGPKVAARMRPWLEFTQATIEGALRGSPFSTMVPAKDLAFAICALFLGIEMLTQLEDDDSSAQSLFETAQRTTTMLAPLLGIAS